MFALHHPLSPARCVLWLMLALAACAPTIPREQVSRANAAYEAVAERSDAMLATLSVAERRTYLRTLRATGAEHDGDIIVPSVFDPASAAYFSSVGDPVLTASLRRGMGLVGDYFGLLVILAEGRSVAEAKGQINTLSASVAGLIAVATGGAALPLAALAKELGPLIDRWGQAQNAEELRRLVLEGEPVVRNQLAAMQAASTTVFETLTREPMRTARTADTDTARRAAFVQMAEAQVLVADYVVLLDKLGDTLAALAAAVRSPGSPPALASLSASADSALIQARAAAGAIAILKAGRAP
jgi:hypothetical protein